MVGVADSNEQRDADALLATIADYVYDYQVDSKLAWDTAYHCLMDSLGCGFLALTYGECRKMLGPVIPGTLVPRGVRVPGTSHMLDPIKAAFDIGVIIRWLDYNDTWLAAEFAHPSDNLGAILAVSDYVSQQRKAVGLPGITLKKVMEAMIKAHELQGVLALENGFNRVGLDHVILVKVASTAVATWLLGGSKSDIINAVSQVWVDGHSLRTYRHAPNTGSRKSWAAGDATSRAVALSLFTLKGEKGYPTALSAKKWGFQDVLFKGNEVKIPQPFGTYVMEHVLFKISFPAEFHAQTAAEAAMTLHESVAGRLEAIEKIELKTQEAGVRIISKTGELRNFADRDHCLQYIVAVALIYGQLTADHYSDEIAKNPLIDELRAKMVVEENERYSKDYLDPQKRSIANSVQIFFNDKTSTEEIEVEYPIGHRRRRSEGIPVLLNKWQENVKKYFPRRKAEEILHLFERHETLEQLGVDELMTVLYLP